MKEEIMDTNNKKISSKLQTAYKEVKAEEAKIPFKERHKRINKYMYETYSSATVGSIPKELAFRIGQGIVHVSGEAFYQLLKLRYIVDDSIPKFIIRNRNLVITTALGAAIIHFSNSTKDKKIETPEKPEISTSAPEKPETDSYHDMLIGGDDQTQKTVILTRKHTVNFNDTFYGLAWDAQMTAEELEKFNGYETSNLLVDTVIKIPYEIAEKDLKYYTKIAVVNGKTIEELANEYETDTDTLINLNNEAIESENDTYKILSETIVVPDFITKNELQEKRAKEYQKNNQ